MNRTINFFKRNLKETFRDPILYIFCLGFPVVMLILFQIINTYTNGNTPMFDMPSLLPAMIMFSYTFVLLTLSLLVSKDRQTMFLKRLYSSPMKPHQFILGYAGVGLLVGIGQTIICIITGFVLATITSTTFVPFTKILLLICSELPILITMIFAGILFGTLFNDKGAPGFSSIFISVAGILGGCWMPLDSMSSFETFCKFLPFYPSVYIGRAITGATKTLGGTYAFDTTAILGIIPIVVFMVTTVILSFVSFKKNMID